MLLKAIETKYKGHRFRSRLEARWAVFFDTLNIEWHYEPECFDLGDAGWYLPDFWLPEQECWIEVKPKNLLTEEATEKARMLAIQSRNYVFVLHEVEPFETINLGEGDTDFRGCNIYFSPSGNWDGMVMWGICPKCGKKQIGHFGTHDISYEEEFDKHSVGCPLLEDYMDSPLLKQAYTAARSARFEFGEEG